MSTTPEGKVKKRLRAFLDSLAPDVWYHMPVPTGYSDKGTPDFLINFFGVFIAIETKATPKQKPTPLQAKCLREIQLAHGVTFVVNNENIEGVIACLTLMQSQLPYPALRFAMPPPSG